jgi:putrescine aminotransferase
VISALREPDGRFEARAAGARVYDDAGRAYLDCAGPGDHLLGYRHPRVTVAVADQLYRRAMPSRVLPDPMVAAAATALTEVTPPGLDRVQFAHSGAEAVQAAVELGTLRGTRRVVVASGGSGRGGPGSGTSLPGGLGAASLSVPYGSAGALAAVLSDGVPSCVVVEPVQADAVLLPPPGYLAAVRTLCDTHGGCLVLDETRTGLGWLGHWWGADIEGVRPDVLCVGGALSGGAVPVAAVAVSTACGPWPPTGWAPATAPIAMAAATAAISTIRAEGLIARAGQLSLAIRARTTAIVRTNCPDLVREIRGAGLLVGVEFGTQRLAEEFAAHLLDRQVLAGRSLAAPRVVRLAPPAVLTDRDLAWLFDAVSGAASALARLPRHHAA